MATQPLGGHTPLRKAILLEEMEGLRLDSDNTTEVWWPAVHSMLVKQRWRKEDESETKEDPGKGHPTDQGTHWIL